MKRKALEKTEPCASPGTAERTAAAQILDIEGTQILEVDIYHKGKLKFRHFLNKDIDFGTLFADEYSIEDKTYRAGDWSAVGLNTAITKRYWYNYYETKGVTVSDETRQIIEEYLPALANRGLKRVEENETDIQYERKERRLDNKIQRIKELMQKVEPVSCGHGFQKWLKDTVFPERYIFAETRKLKTGFRYRCAECGRTSILKEKPRHNTELQCPKCHVAAVVKTRVRQMVHERDVVVIQRVDDSTVIRYFAFQAISGTECKKTTTWISHCEKKRVFSGTPKAKEYYGQEEWAREGRQVWWDKRNLYCSKEKMYAFVYVQDASAMEEDIKRVVMAGMQRGAELPVKEILRSYNQWPCLEYLIKGKYIQLVKDLLTIYGYWSAPSCIDRSASGLEKVLKLDRQRAHRLRDMNGGRHVLKALQEEARTGQKISQENLDFIQRHKVEVEKLQGYRTGLPVNREINYIRRQMEKSGGSYSDITEIYGDYLDMAQEKGMDITDDIIRTDARLKERHDAYVEEQNRERDKDFSREMNRKYRNIARDYGENAAMWEWHDDRYNITVPKGAQDIVREGRLQHHCVAASETYMRKMHSHETYILFLRRKDKPDTPYYTLEAAWNGDKVDIMQKRAAYNRQPDIKNIDRVLSEWKKDVERRRKNAGRNSELQAV